MSTPVEDLALQLSRWDSAQPAPEKLAEINAIVDRIMANKASYEAVDAATDVPWYVVAALHNMESGGSFKCHLHEGSPLTGRTRFVPKGRPLAGNPPFTWKESAVDAVLYEKLGEVPWLYLAQTLMACERYNGTGYLRYHPETPSPYLWAGTTIEKPGKYVTDGKWDPKARSKQIGVAAIFKVMQQRGILNFSKLKR